MIRATNAIVAIVLIAAALRSYAWALDLPSFQIEVPDGWTYSVEADPGDEQVDLVTFYRTGEGGHLKIMSYKAPVAITEDRLRSLTNIDARVPLAWQQWGEFAGYHYEYEEQGAFYRQWFLVNGQTLLLVTYQGDSITKEQVAADLYLMIRSLTINSTPMR